MTSLILIHGGAHGSWCWDPILEPLRAAGYEVQAVDLPGRGGTHPDGSTVTLEDWVATVSAAVDAASSTPWLIAHSMGGLSSSQVAERRPSDIAGIVYVSAVVPTDGGAGLPTLAEAGPDCALLAEGAIVPATTDGSVLAVPPEHARIAFYGECAEADVQVALTKLCGEPATPMMTPLQLGAGFASVTKHYLGATKDRAVPPALQREMADRAGATFTPIESDHSPFYSAPQEFVAILRSFVD